MKKLSIIGFALLAVVTLSACSNSKTKQKADQSTKPTKYVKLVNENNQTKLVTKKVALLSTRPTAVLAMITMVRNVSTWLYTVSKPLTIQIRC